MGGQRKMFSRIHHGSRGDGTHELAKALGSSSSADRVSWEQLPICAVKVPASDQPYIICRLMTSSPLSR